MSWDDNKFCRSVRDFISIITCGFSAHGRAEAGDGADARGGGAGGPRRGAHRERDGARRGTTIGN